MCIKELFWPPYEAKIKKNDFLQFVLTTLLKQKQSVKVSNYFDFYHCYGNKNGGQNRLKRGN